MCNVRMNLRLEQYSAVFKNYDKLFKSTALPYPSRSNKIKNKRRNKRRVRK